MNDNVSKIRPMDSSDARKVCMDYTLPYSIQVARHEEAKLFRAVGIVAGFAIICLVAALAIHGFIAPAHGAEPVPMATDAGQSEIRWSRWCKITGLC